MGFCNSTSNKIPHIMLAGIQNSGKTYFLYTSLKTVIKSDGIKTKPTDSFNYEVYEVGSVHVGIWDVPGKETLRIFWPNFYRNIDFTGLIYMVNYENKDTLAEAVKVMHDLLSEEELKDVNLLVIVNYAKKYQKDDVREDEEKSIEEGDVYFEESENDSKIYFEVKKNIYYDLIKQSKMIYVVDIFNEKTQSDDYKQTRNVLKSFISGFQ